VKPNTRSNLGMFVASLCATLIIVLLVARCSNADGLAEDTQTPCVTIIDMSLVARAMAQRGVAAELTLASMTDMYAVQYGFILEDLIGTIQMAYQTNADNKTFARMMGMACEGGIRPGDGRL